MGAFRVLVFASAAVLAWWFWSSSASADELGAEQLDSTAVVDDEPPSPDPALAPEAPEPAPAPAPEAGPAPPADPGQPVAEPVAPAPEPARAGGLRTADPSPAPVAADVEPATPASAPPADPAVEPAAPSTAPDAGAAAEQPSVVVVPVEPAPSRVTVEQAPPAVEAASFDLAHWSFAALLPWSNASAAVADPGGAPAPADDGRRRAAATAVADLVAAEAGPTDQAWITSSATSALALAGASEGDAPVRPAPLPVTPAAPLPSSSGALASHAPFDLSQQLERPLLWAVIAAAAGAAAAMTGRPTMLSVAPAGVCGRRPPFTPD